MYFLPLCWGLILAATLPCMADEESMPAFPIKHPSTEALHRRHTWKETPAKNTEGSWFPLFVRAFCTPTPLSCGAGSGALPSHRRRDSTLFGASPRRASATADALSHADTCPSPAPPSQLAPSHQPTASGDPRGFWKAKRVSQTSVTT